MKNNFEDRYAKGIHFDIRNKGTIKTLLMILTAFNGLENPPNMSVVKLIESQISSLKKAGLDNCPNLSKLLREIKENLPIEDDEGHIFFEV